MSAVLERTVWPELPPPAPVKKWIEEFYTATSSNSQKSTDVLVNSITDDGEVINVGRRTKGREAFREWRNHAWDHIEHRTHELLNIYSADSKYSDIVIRGLLTGTFKNGAVVSQEYVARIEFDPATLATEPKSFKYQDSAPWTAAMRG